VPVGRPPWVVIAATATATAIPLNLLFASTLSGLLHALREAFPTPPPPLTSDHTCLALCPLPSAPTRSLHPHPTAARPCLFSSRQEPVLALQLPPVLHCPFSDLQPSLRPACICDTSPALRQSISRTSTSTSTSTTASSRPPSLDTLPRLDFAPVHDDVTARTFLGGILLDRRQPRFSTAPLPPPPPCSLTTRAPQVSCPPIGNPRRPSSLPTAHTPRRAM